MKDVEGEWTTRFKKHVAVEDRLEFTNDVMEKRKDVSGAHVRVLQLDHLFSFPTGCLAEPTFITATLPLATTVRVDHTVHTHEPFLVFQALEYVRQRVKNLRTIKKMHGEFFHLFCGNQRNQVQQ